AAAYAREAAPARASLCHHLHEIARAVTNGRHAAATEIRDHQLAALALTHRSAACRVNHFKDELGFVQVNRAALRLAVESPRADLRSACMIEAGRTPCRFNRPLDRREARARLACMNRPPDRSSAQVAAL